MTGRQRLQAACIAALAIAYIALGRDQLLGMLADPITAIVLIAQGVAAAGGIAAIGLTAAMATYIAIGASIVGGVMARRKAARAAAAARNAARESLQERTMVLSSSEPSPQIIYGRATVGGAVVDRISSPKSILTDGGAVKLKPDALQHVVIALACHEITEVHRVHMFGEWHTWHDGTKEVGGTYAKTGASHITASITASSTGTATLPGLPAWVTVSQVLSITQTGTEGTVTAPAGWSNNGAAITGLPANSTWSVTYETTSNEPSLRVEWHPGTETQAASPYLLGVAPGRWTAAHQLKGIAYVVLTLDLDDARFQNGLPQDLAFDVSGKPVLDPRTGVPAWSDNTALCIYDWLRSPWGYGLTAGDIDTASVVAAANACDTIVLHPTAANPCATGRFSVCGGSFKASDERSSVLGDLAENMGGFTVPGALWTMHAGTWSAPVMQIDDSHLGGPVQIVRSSTPHDEAFNSARATIITQGKRDSQDVDPYSNPVFVADDGGLQWSTFTLPFCQSATQARNLLRQFVEQSRAGMVISLTGDMRLWPLQAGDRISVSNSEYAWSGKTFRVMDAAWAPGLPVSITAQEDIAASYDSADATDADPAPNTGLPDPGTVDTPMLQLPASGNAELIRHADGTILPRVLVTWLPTVTLYMQGPGARTDVSWRRVTDDAWTDTRVPAGETQTYLSGMREGDMLVITVRHVNSAGFASRWVSQSHRVVGKSAPPGNITALSVVDTPTGGRRYTVAHVQDLDHLGYEVRYSGNLSATWSQMTAVAARWDGAALVFDGGVPVDGVWRFAACAVDTSRNYSAAPIYVTVTLAGIALATDPGIGGGNQLFNSDFGLSWRGWTSVNGGALGTREINKPDWTLSATTPISGTTVAIRNGASTAGYHEEWSDPIPVTPLDWYCASAYTGVVGCRAAVFAYFFNETGTLSNSYGLPATCENDFAGGGGALSGYKRIYGVGQAPGAAKFARLVIRKYDTSAGQSSSYAFACRAMFEQVGGASAEPGPWSPGPLGYSGDLDATIGAPVGTMVGGREAGAAIQSIDAAQAAANTAQNAASASQQSANAALTRLQAIDSDGVLARGEKQSVVMDWTELWNSRQGVVDSAAIYSVSSAAFTDALSALSAYLLSLSPGWSDTSQDTTIIPATFRTLWDAAYQSRTATLNAVAAKAKQLVDAAAVAASNAQAAAASAQTSANAALGRLQAQASDGVLSAMEKKSTLIDWSEISGARNGIVAQANVYGIITERDAYTGAVTALSDYLTSLSPSWADTSQDTLIVPAVYRSTWDAVYQRRQDLLNKIYSSAKALADQANLGVADINSDSKWSPVEKAALVVDWQELDGSNGPLYAQASAYGITSERDAMVSAVAELGTYLASLVPAWNDTTQTTTIVRSVADSKWASAYAARRALELRIADEAGKRATWTTVTGAGRPQDNATVGAAFGASGNITGQITEVLAPVYIAENAISEEAGVMLGAISGFIDTNGAGNPANIFSLAINASGGMYVRASGKIGRGNISWAGSPGLRIDVYINGSLAHSTDAITGTSESDPDYRRFSIDLFFSGQYGAKTVLMKLVKVGDGSFKAFVLPGSMMYVRASKR